MKKSKSEQLHFFKKVVRIPLYGGNFVIIFSNDTDMVERIVKCRMGAIEYLYAFTFHNFIHKGHEAFCVCFNFWTTDPITTGTLVHEITHVGNRILQSRELEPDWSNDEAECYLKGWCADQVEKFMKDCKIV
jgi:hypothetical protein